MTRDPLFGLRPPKPSPMLRSRVLREARRAATEPRPGRLERLVDRLWDNRPLRLAWVAAALVLLALNFGAGGGGDLRPDASPAAVRGTAWAEVGPAGRLRPQPEHTLESYSVTIAIEQLGL